MTRLPLSFLILAGFGLLCALAGTLSLLGLGGELHPLLDDAMAGLALLVSAIALFGSAAFPLVIARLQAREEG